MTTEQLSDYEILENKMIEVIEEIMSRFNVNKEEIINVISDRIEDDYCDNPSCLKHGCNGEH